MRLNPALWSALLCCLSGALGAETVTQQPYPGVTLIRRVETIPRPFIAHIVQIDLSQPGLRFKLTPPTGSRETTRQTTRDFLIQQHAQLAINAHFFLPFPSEDAEAFLVGLAASDGTVYSGFEAPAQSYALVPAAPALNLDSQNHASIVHAAANLPAGSGVREKISLFTVVSGSAQVLTGGVKTIPAYLDAEHANGVLQEGGPNRYSNRDSWYDRINARTLLGITQDARTLVVLIVDRAGASQGLSVGEAADLLQRDYRVWDALNLDGGGSSTLAMEMPDTHEAHVLNQPSEGPLGRSVGSNLAIFVPETHADSRR